MSQLDTLIRPIHAIGLSGDALPVDRFSTYPIFLSSEDIIPRSFLVGAAVGFVVIDLLFVLNSCLAELRSWLAGRAHDSRTQPPRIHR